jgi:hypothetical protein
MFFGAVVMSKKHQRGFKQLSETKRTTVDKLIDKAFEDFLVQNGVSLRRKDEELSDLITLLAQKDGVDRDKWIADLKTMRPGRFGRTYPASAALPTRMPLIREYIIQDDGE